MRRAVNLSSQTDTSNFIFLITITIIRLITGSEYEIIHELF